MLAYKLKNRPLQKKTNKKKNSTAGLTGELFHLSPCDVVSFSSESLIMHIPSSFVDFHSAINDIVYFFKVFKLHLSFLQSALVEKPNRCHFVFSCFL